MSLGGIAIAIGAMVDAVIIMIENAHKHLEHDKGKKDHWSIIRDASIEVGPALFYSLLVITVSFLPVFTLQAQEGRLFKPLAFTKTYSMAAAALLSITLAPVLMGYLIRGQNRARGEEPDQSVPHLDLPSASLIGHPLALVGCHRSPPLRCSGCFCPGTGWWRKSAARWAGQGIGLQSRQGLPVPEPRFGIHAAALRRRPALHAHDFPGHLDHQSARTAPANRQDHQALSRK